MYFNNLPSCLGTGPKTIEMAAIFFSIQHQPGIEPRTFQKMIEYTNLIAGWSNNILCKVGPHEETLIWTVTSPCSGFHPLSCKESSRVASMRKQIPRKWTWFHQNKTGIIKRKLSLKGRYQLQEVMQNYSKLLRAGQIGLFSKLKL